MRNKTKIFDDEYTSGTETSSEEEEDIKADKLEAETDVKRYGIAKPERIIIRAKLTSSDD